jgi:hypothetical protein
MALWHLYVMTMAALQSNKRVSTKTGRPFIGGNEAVITAMAKIYLAVDPAGFIWPRKVLIRPCRKRAGH